MRKKIAGGVKVGVLGLAMLLGAASLPLKAAPLDALLDARPARNYLYGFIELGGDFVNDTVDVLGVRDEKDAANGVGDYTGAHLRLGWQFTDRLWLEGSAWQRQVKYGPDEPEVESYSVAAQYRLLDQPQMGSWRPDLAVRAGYWINETSSFKKSSNSEIRVSVFPDPVVINQAEISDARDEQTQIDLIASWSVNPKITLSVFAGYGEGEVTIGRISAFQSLVGTIQSIGGCSGSVKLSNGSELKDAISVDGEVCHKHSYQQVGANIQWLPWDALTLRAGYLYQSIDRKQIDELVKQYGGKPITEGHTLIGEAAYRFAKFGQVFARGQLMSGPFLGEIPFLYNRITAPRFDKEYGFVTVGLILDF